MGRSLKVFHILYKTNVVSNKMMIIIIIKTFIYIKLFYSVKVQEWSLKCIVDRSSQVWLCETVLSTVPNDPRAWGTAHE